MLSFFFFDMLPGEGKPYERDSIMAANITQRFRMHPQWKLITLSGNNHNRIPKSGSFGNGGMASVLQQLMGPVFGTKICTLNQYYRYGSCVSDFGNGLEEKELSNPDSEYDTALAVSRYLVLVAANSTYPYTGIYDTRHLTLAKIVAQ